MSAWILCTEEKRALLAVDSLAVRVDGSPYKYTTKAFLLPHLRMHVSGTGSGGFAGKWFNYINDNIVVEGIDHLDQYAPEILPVLWQRHKEDFSLPSEITATIYHVGFSEEHNIIHAYSYRSTSGFASEPLSRHGLYVRPECDVPEEYKFPDDFKALMDLQRAAQAALPHEERVYIGGEVYVYDLREAGAVVYRLGRFED